MKKNSEVTESSPKRREMSILAGVRMCVRARVCIQFTTFQTPIMA